MRSNTWRVIGHLRANRASNELCVRSGLQLQCACNRQEDQKRVICATEVEEDYLQFMNSIGEDMDTSSERNRDRRTDTWLY